MNERLVVSLKKSPELEVRPPREHESERSVSWKWYVTVLGCALLLIGLGYWYKTSRQSSESVENTSADAQAVPKEMVEKEASDLVAEVGKLILLPKDEVPTIATVTDPSKLADQAFFANAKAGDKVLLYTKARKAYLYDPIARRLIEVAPITTELPQ